MASWFEKNIGRPLKDLLRGSAAVEKDQIKADQAKERKKIEDFEKALARQAINEAPIFPMSPWGIDELNASEKDKSISDMQEESAPKPDIEVDLDQGKRYTMVLAVLIGLYIVMKVMK